MRKYWIPFVLCWCFLCYGAEPKIVVHHRVLTTVNNQPISVLDVMKQMDVFLHEQSPQTLASPTLRFQFYTTQWRGTLQRMIDHELMMLDATTLKVEVSDSDVREEIQNRYGPNVAETLDLIGIGYEEAKRMVHQELIVQRMQWFRVTSKAMAKVTSELVVQAYKHYLQQHPPQEQWTYRVATFRYPDSQHGLETASAFARTYDPNQPDLEKTWAQFVALLPMEERELVSLSPETVSERRQLSEHYRAALETLPLDSFSTPLLQKTRDGAEVVRLFYLKHHNTEEPEPFSALSSRLKQELLHAEVNKEMDRYLAKLRLRYGTSADSFTVPSHFEPFGLHP